MTRYFLAGLISGLLILTAGCGGAGANSHGLQNSGANSVNTSDNSSSNQSSSQSSQSAPPPPGQNSALPSPPSNAVVISHIEKMGNWQSCNSKDCSGGSGSGEFWMAANQSSPSLSGSSLELHNSGTWSNALWWNKFGVQEDATNFLWDFYFQVDDASTKAAQALEFDLFQFRAGYNYMMGSQCDYGAGVWDLWDETSNQWMKTSVACPKFSPGVWHHVTWYTQRVPDGAQYKFVTLVVDGTAYEIDQTYAARNLNWSANLGVQYQLDVNATGQGYQEWIDQSTLTVW